MRIAVTLTCKMLIILLIITSFATSGTAANEEAPRDATMDIFINLKAARFDPLFEEPDIPAELKFTSENPFYLVQLNGPIQGSWLFDISDLGGTILGYIPDYTYIVYAKEDVKSDIADLPFVRWIGIYHPAYKIELGLLSKQGQVQLNVMVFPEPNRFVNLAYVEDEIVALGGNIIGNDMESSLILAEVDSSKITDIAFIPEVEWIDQYSPPVSLMDNIRVFTGAESPLYEYGFNGTGIVGEVKDAGLDQDHVEFEGQLIGLDGNVDEDSHGTSTFGIVFAKGVDERAMGMLPGGKGVFCDWGVGRKQSIANLVNNWGGLFQSNSWHSGSTDGSYGSNTRQNDEAVFEYDVSILYASGNGGSDGSITQEATAKNVISVGALNHYNNQDRTDDLHNGNQGNKGPTQDGRIKPDIVGPYDSIYTTTSGGGYTSGFGGTSGATPVAAGAVGLINEMYRENHFKNNPSGTLPHASTVKAILIADAYQYEFSQGDRFAQGWGLVDVGNVYFIGENHLIDDESISLKTGESKLYSVKPTGIHSLKISLVWTDVPGTTSASKHLINDLTLRVTDPDGAVYYGNVGLETSKWSSQGGSADNTNNVENVFIESPVSGDWTIEVIADNIASDGNPDTGDVDQNFALVASGIIVADHDMVVSDMEELPRYFALNEEAVVNGTVSNIGFQHENDVTVNLLEDGVVVDTQNIGSVQSATSIPISLSWVPVTDKSPDVSIEVVPVVGENRLVNNEMTESVDLFSPLGYVLVDESHGNDENHDSYYQYLYSLTYPDSYTTTTITESILARYNVLVTARATTDYTPSELSAIQSFVENGGGLLVIGDDSSTIYNDLTGYAGITWTTPQGIGGTITDINPHNVTEGVNELNLPSPNLVLEIIEPPAQEIAYDNNPVLARPVIAVSEYGNGRIVALADDNCLDNGNLDSLDNRQFGENVIKWLITNLTPVAIIDSPPDGSIYSSTFSIPFDGSSSYDLDGYIVDYTWTSDIDGTIGNEAVFNTQLSVGDHIITLRVTDNVDKTSTASITLTINPPTPPEITIGSPGNSQVVNGLVTISGSASDVDGTVERVDVRIGGGGWTQAVGTENWDYDWDTTSYSDGDWTIQARSLDNEGQYSDINSISVTIDNTPPIIISDPTATSITETEATIEWETDEPSDSLVEYGIDSSYGNSESNSSFGTYHSIDLIDLSPGTTYHFRVQSRDEIGNDPTTSGDRTFTTDIHELIPPTVTIGSPGNGQVVNGMITILGSASDTDGSVVIVEVRTSDGDWVLANGIEDWDYDWDTTSNPDGECTIQARSMDNEALYSDISSVTVTIDNNLEPEAIIDSPIDDSSYTSTSFIPFNGSSSYDPDGNIDDYVWTSDIDGTIGIAVAFDTQLSVGVHDITLKVTDNGGKISNTSITLTINVPHPPEITLDSPSNDDVVNGIVIISGTAFDSDGSVEGVEVKFGNKDWDFAAGAEDWDYDWDTTFYSDGDWTIQVRSNDNEDLHSDIGSITVTIDNTPPIITGPSASSITDTSATIKWETDEPGDCIVEYGTDPSYGNLTTKSTLVTMHNIVLKDLSHSTTYHYRIKTRDALGNMQNASGDRTFTTQPPPDTTPPEVAISNINEYDVLIGNVQVNVDAADNRGIDRVEFYINSQFKLTDSSPEYTWLWETANGQYPDGFYSIKIVVYDTSDNEAEYEITVELDNEVIPPVIIRNKANPNSIENSISNDVLFTVEVSDPEEALEEVVIDLSSIGRSPYQTMYDDGTHGDVVSGDSIYSFEANVPSDTNDGEKSLTVTLIYDGGKTIESTVSLYVIAGQQEVPVDDKELDSNLETNMIWLLLVVIVIIAGSLGGVGFMASKKRKQRQSFQVVEPVYVTPVQWT